MDFTPDEIGGELARGLRSVLESHLSGGGIRKATSEPVARTALRDDLIEQGAAGTMIPEEAGGLGLGWASSVQLLEEFGLAGTPGEFLDSMVLVPGIAALVGGDFTSRWADLAEGTLSAGLVDLHGRVLEADRLDAVLVRQNKQLSLYPLSAVDIAESPGLDGGAVAHRISVTGQPDLTVSLSDQTGAHLEAAGYLSTAAALVGVTRRIVKMTSDYAAQREQFGRPIGSFQAIAHPLANVALAVEFAAPLVTAAAWELDNRRHSALTSACHAKAAASSAATLAWRTGLQSHGAIGFTEEYDLQLWLKRAITLSAQHGTVYDARRRLRESFLTSTLETEPAQV